MYKITRLFDTKTITHPLIKEGRWYCLIPQLDFEKEIKENHNFTAYFSGSIKTFEWDDFLHPRLLRNKSYQDFLAKKPKEQFLLFLWDEKKNVQFFKKKSVRNKK